MAVRGQALTVAMFALAAFGTPAAQAQTYTVLHRFTEADGGAPYAGLIADPAGDLFGATSYGGPYFSGTVFKQGKTQLIVLHSFTGRADGAAPCAGLIRDSAGNLFGTTEAGGKARNGTVFKVDAAGVETVLHSFTGGLDGGTPCAGLLLDAAGNLYGTTTAGGTSNWGTVFKLDKTGETVLHSFTGGSDGGGPAAGLIQDPAGNLYGTTESGGTVAGTVFKLDRAGTETVLYSFTGGADGGYPYAGLTRDSAGNLYGATVAGGSSGYGVIFKLDTTGNETVLHAFTGGADGGSPFGTPIQDSEGNLYGTTQNGGSAGNGVVFELNTTGTETVLYNFAEAVDGRQPYAGLFRDSAGNLYGTTVYGGGSNPCNESSCGVVFKIAP
jgi:uncharacterized repeat protein (TIGR03803 family)